MSNCLKSLTLVGGLLLLSASLAGQNTPYFQQEVHYRIRVSLDDSTHVLTGDLELDYLNRSPDTLREIWMHLWPNAYQSRQTAFCRQKIRQGDMEFYYAPDSLLGRLDNLNFTVDGAPTPSSSDPDNPDIAMLRLARPLAPGAQLTLKTPFRVQIPGSFSRLGHVATSYQITQWYPKPAVYDRNGWHPMPYLDMGEFYSEFGSFYVEITLPANYVVGATGTLQTPSEIQFLNQKAAECRELLAADTLPRKGRRTHEFPRSATETKTLRFTAENVHDFAWFADKRFFVLHDTAVLASGKQVDCWAMFPDEESHLWKKGAFYVKRAVEFYSRHVGEYPWPQATAVHSALSAGGGMEYPMITVIGNSGSAKSLDEVITHEVGHNWFYGILASNERNHPWMDEGMNSYYEGRYMREYYDGGGMINIQLPKGIYDPKTQGAIDALAILLLAREGVNTPPDTHSDDMTMVAYGLHAYMKPALAMRWLEQASGTAPFDAAMQAYFQQWKMKHPGPEDFRRAMEQSGIEIGWFMDAMQTNRRFDVAVTKARRQGDGKYAVTLKNKGNLPAPVRIDAVKDNRVISSRWAPAFDKKITLDNFEADAPDHFVADADMETLDFNRSNNFLRSAGLFPGIEPLRIRALAPVEHPSKSQIGVLPWVGWNNYDKTMLGLLLYRPPFPSGRFQYYLAPGVGLASGRMAGAGHLSYRYYPGGIAPKITVGVNGRMAGVDYLWDEQKYAQYYRVSPFLRATLKSGNPSFFHDLTFSVLFTGTQLPLYGDEGEFGGLDWDHNTLYRTVYGFRHYSRPNPFDGEVALEYQDFNDPFGRAQRYLKASAEWRQKIFYREKKKITARFFGGYFIHNDLRNVGSLGAWAAPAVFSLNPQGFNDYRFEQVYLGRTEESGIFGQQVSQTEGGFKNAFGRSNAGVLGNSTDFVLALNLKADLPFRLPLNFPLRPYFDVGYFHDATALGRNRPAEEQLLWSGGVMVELFKGALEVYFPLVNSPYLADRYCDYANGNDKNKLFCGGNYWKAITWSVRLRRIEPMEIAGSLIN